MKYSRILRPLAIAIVLSLVMVVMPARPALAAPVITLSPTSGAVGTRVTISGTNFASYVGDSLKIYFNDVEIADSPKPVPSTGSFEASFDIPDNVSPGTSWITIRGPLASVLARSPFIVPKTEIALDVKEGTVGSAVRITGRGFYASKIVAFYYHLDGVTEKLGTATASTIGECTLDFLIPQSSAGKKKISAENAQGNSAEAELEVIPLATLDPPSAIVGELIGVSGTGFSAASEVIVYLQTSTVAYADTDEYGSFTATFRVPEIAAGSYTVRVQDEDNNVDRLEFAITADARLDKTTGSIGTDVTVSGTGFEAGGTVDVKYDDNTVTTATTDDTGAFSVAFTVPTSTGGEHTVTVTDSQKTSQLTFTIETEAPPVPKLLTPAVGAELKSPVSFHWEEVFDPSLPVVYSFQLASDEAFTGMQVERKGLADTEYTLAEQEELKPSKKGSPYYWRVKAIDSASNESEWSAPGSFYIKSSSFLPTWAIIALIAFGVVVIIFIVWRLRREPV
jgi:hypothetical protein